MDYIYTILFDAMQKTLNPFIFSVLSSVTGLLVMLGYITPKGADALNSFFIFCVGAVLMSLSVIISHIHHAEITQIHANSTATTPLQTTTLSPIPNQ